MKSDVDAGIRACIPRWSRPPSSRGGPRATVASSRAGTVQASLLYSLYTSTSARAVQDSSSSASSRRCRSVSAPSVLVSLMWYRARNFLHLVPPQRRWLLSTSPISQVSAASGGSRMTSAAEASPSAIRRFSSARASLTALARSSARSRCGAGVTVAVSDIWCFVSSHSSAWADPVLRMRQGSSRPPPVGPVLLCCCWRAPKRAVLVTPDFRPSLPSRPPSLLGRFGRSRSYDIRAGNSNVTTAGHALRAHFF
jgi:hypothetical protein